MDWLIKKTSNQIKFRNWSHCSRASSFVAINSWNASRRTTDLSHNSRMFVSKVPLSSRLPSLFTWAVLNQTFAPRFDFTSSIQDILFTLCSVPLALVFCVMKLISLVKPMRVTALWPTIQFTESCLPLVFSKLVVNINKRELECFYVVLILLLLGMNITE